MLGGEQSGHILCRHYSITGDGLTATLHLAALVRQTGMRLSELVDQSFQTYPSCYAMCELKTAIAAWAGNTAKLSNERSHKPKQQWASKDSVRASGTEPVIRVIEAVSADLTHYWAQQLVLAVQQHLQS